MSGDVRISSEVKELAILACAVLLAFAIYGAYSEWSDRKAAKKSEVSEFMRRNSLTPEQRIAEDAAKANKIAIEKAERDRAARVAAREIAEAPFKAACQEALMSTLYDPAAAQITKNFGEIAANGNYNGWIEGRAKNAFGAYIIGGWSCAAHKSGSSIAVTEVSQYKP